MEQSACSLSIIQELSRAGLPIQRLRPDKDKIARALSAVARYEEHCVFHPREAPWLSELEDELLAFPSGAHDDQVDAVAYAAIELPNLPLNIRFQRSRGESIMGNVLEREF